MPQRALTLNVMDAALERLMNLYEDGHRLVVSFSGGKDSGVCLELAIMAARLTNRLPVDVIMRDEEIMFPGTFEYCERVAARADVSFHWITAHQPIINYFNREQPYFWVFDPLVPPQAWVRQPPQQCYAIPERHIQGMVTPQRFPVEQGKELFSIIGLRASESNNRRMAVYSSRGYLTKPNSEYGVRYCRPIYDWMDGDVWKAISENGWDYNHAYDVMHRIGMARDVLRIAPPTMTSASIKALPYAMRAWPAWFDRVCQRLPGVRSAAHFGTRAIYPLRREDEDWEACFYRTCIREAPAWIAARAQQAIDFTLSAHARHATVPFPQVTHCPRCTSIGSWKAHAYGLYMGDPFSMKFQRLPLIEPEFFREGAGVWGGRPTF